MKHILIINPIAGKRNSTSMLMEKAKELGLTPMATILSYGSRGLDPAIMGYGPFYATKAALEKANLTVEDLDLIEANEAFASQSIAVARDLQFDPAKVNVNGGAIAIGHPAGCTGARMVMTLCNELHRRPEAKYALATMCVAGGFGSAVVMEKV